MEGTQSEEEIKQGPESDEEKKQVEFSQKFYDVSKVKSVIERIPESFEENLY